MSFDIVVADWLMGTAAGVPLGLLGTRGGQVRAISGLAPENPSPEHRLAWEVDPEDQRLVDLKDSEEVRQYLERPDTAVYIVRRPDDTVVWASPSLRKVLGHDPAAIVGRNAWGIFLAPEDIEPAAVYSARMSEGDLTAWAPLKRADGSKLWVRFDALNRESGIVVAFWPETESSKHTFHGFARAPPGEA